MDDVIPGETRFRDLDPRVRRLFVGFAFSALGSGLHSVQGAACYSLTMLPNGDLVAGGFFTSAGGTAANPAFSSTARVAVFLGQDYAASHGQ